MRIWTHVLQCFIKLHVFLQWCGMIRFDPDMLRSLRVHCVLAVREKDRQVILFRKRKTLGCAVGTLKVSL